MDYDDLLRRLSLHDERVVSDAGAGSGAAVPTSGAGLDPKTLALVRLAALVTIGGSVPSYGAHVDAAVDAGASVAEIVEVLLGVVPVIGLPRVVTAAPQLALALGHDVEDDFGSLPKG
ncbi:carboxymuconolactone decarboxylase family protein [Nocardioides sp. W7]|uniref:carboxymuconolactone decarboxylase family protein n=1 Tax=Nocardioides sp. W7 TaxID=2931390 RepID=UPI001FD1682B|nr:carboxymuconolactone decarboxylase family protein [Nocardioides sp. W7]